MTIPGNSFFNSNTVVGSGTAATETRNVSDFSAVVMYGSGQLIVDHGDVEALTITGDDNLLPYLTSDVQNGKLSLGTKPNTSITNRVQIVYHLTVKKLDAVESYGSGSADVNGVATDKLSVTTKGSGNVKVAGKVTTQEISLSGSGDYNAENLDSRQASVQASGSGSATVRVSDSLNVQLNGSGSVGYHGDPSLTKAVNGSGRVYKR
jgi:Putative auto-transporter adhesin, head GIN domain